MKIVISNPTPVANEHLVVNQLFDAGLDVFHLRRPEADIDEIERVLSKIDASFYSKIALHQCHELAEKFGMTRLHYPEGKRKSLDNAHLESLRKGGNVISTSIHVMTDYHLLSENFDYCFFGPVFNSISKQEYSSVMKADLIVKEETATRMIALGGIDETTIGTIKPMGFSGFALLGAIWQSEKPIEKFRIIAEKWHENHQLY